MKVNRAVFGVLILIGVGILGYAITLGDHGPAANAKFLSCSQKTTEGAHLVGPLTKTWRGRFTALGGSPAATLETVKVGQQAPRVILGHATSIGVPEGSIFSLRGWALDLPDFSAAGGVLVRTDGQIPIVAKYGISRPDVARAYGNPGLEDSGYDATILASKPGIYTVHVLVLNACRNGYYNLGQAPTRLRIIVSPFHHG